MIDRKKLLNDLKPLLRAMEEDLRARCDEVPEIDLTLQAEYNAARSAGRTGAAYEQWRADLITQVGVAWVLSCVFVRFLEDNALTTAAKISGPLHGAGEGAGLIRARDERDLYFQSHSTDTDRDYLLNVFKEFAALPATAELFGPHNPLNEHPDWLSGDAAQKIIEFFQKIDTDGTGEIVHDFTDEAWDTRFLGDLYQDLSEATRKKYALLQTPKFVEEFILERTLEPAIKEFGLAGLKMIDPACGSGHFLLGAFARLLDHWRSTEPGTGERELINRALSSVHGVDINPYAVAIARFRLLLAAMRECGITRLKDAPNFQLNLACGDSLLHGSTGSQQILGFHELAHHYQSEDIEELRRILRPGQYHAVVANPPYIRPQDAALNSAYRDRYTVCRGKYGLAVPFVQRILDLAQSNAYTGQITANSFMNNEFGSFLIEDFLVDVDLTHIIDTSGAFIPGHSTPTVILLCRNRSPVSDTIRAVMGISGEPGSPDDPSQGLVWKAILQQVDHPGSESSYVSVVDMDRIVFSKHPWSIGGGGASELREAIESRSSLRLDALVDSIGVVVVTLADDAFASDRSTCNRHQIPGEQQVCFYEGERLRDWGATDAAVAVFPYSGESLEPELLEPVLLRLWPLRTGLCNRMMFSKTQLERGMKWYEYGMIIRNKYREPLSIAFAYKATHNHFVLVRGQHVFKQTAPVIKPRAGTNERACYAILGAVNSSTACFWERQVHRSTGGYAHGKWQERLERNSTKVARFPMPDGYLDKIAAKMQHVADGLAFASPSRIWGCHSPPLESEKLAQASIIWLEYLHSLISLQEELDWQAYAAHGIVDEPLVFEGNLPGIELGQRAFEIVLAQKMAAGEEESTWFQRHNSTPITDIPVEWPEEYKRVVQRRIEIIESDRNIGLIERPEYKRRWNIEPWELQQEKALRNWLLGRLESYFDLDGRMNDNGKITAHTSLRQPRLTSIAQVADIARADNDFMQAAELYRQRADFDIGGLVAELVESESVPHLTVLRYKPSGLDKRVAWERTWELQRLEDDIDALFEIDRLKAVKPEQIEQTLRPDVWALRIEDDRKPAVLGELLSAAKNLANIVDQKLNLASEEVIKPITDATKRAKANAVGDIPVPPKYRSSDFLSTGGARYWNLRGKLDVPKERWVSFPHCEGEDGSGVIAWAGYDHLQLAQAVAERFENARQHEGRTLVPLLASLGQLIPWLKQWHNEMDPAFGMRLGDYFESHLKTEAKALNMTVEEAMAWKPPAKAKKVRKKAKKARKENG